MINWLSRISLCIVLLLCVQTYERISAQEELHTLNLTDVSLSYLVDDVARLTGYTFVHHPDLSGRVTVSSQVPLGTDEVFRVFLSTLRVHGFTAVPAGRGVYRLVPEEIGVGEAERQLSTVDGFTTAVFRMDHFNAVEATKIIRPLLGGQGQIHSSAASNLLFVVDYGSNMGRIRSLIEELDEDTSITRTMQLKTVPVEEMAGILNALSFGGGDGDSGNGSFSATPAPASNSIVLRGEAADIESASRVVRELDEAPASSKEARMFALDHSEASAIAPILQEIVVGRGGEEGGAAAVETRIAVYEPTNTLIVSASPQSMLIIEEIVKELDASRRQVLVEAIIVDVSDDAERELGLQFLAAGENGDVPFVSSTFSNDAPNLLALTGALSGDLPLGDGSADLIQSAAVASLLGFQGITAGFGARSGGTLFSVILNALEEDNETTVLSTPSILTLDNQPAMISVGQEIPIVSGSVLGNANANPFTTVERREIGIILNVTPRIGADEIIQLEINQEVSSIDAMVGDVTQDFILNQRQIETNINAKDGELIVLGGLIQAEDTLERQKVPLLGDIPVVGRAFQNKQVSREKSNLMVFIRPTIVRDTDEARDVTERSYNYIRAQQIISNEGGEASIDQFVSEVLDGNVPTDEEIRSPKRRRGRRGLIGAEATTDLAASEAAQGGN